MERRTEKKTDESKTRIPGLQRLAEKSVSGSEKKRKLRTEENSSENIFWHRK